MTSETSGEGASKEGLEGIPVAGDVIAGKFVVEEVLGVGGMGVVVSARHAQLGQKVAIKFLRKDAKRSPEAVSRFLREARSVVGLHSAHVVRVMDVGVLDDGMPYMVMEHLVGTDLQTLLAERKTLPVGDAADFLLQSMEAIAEAHAMGIIHRDLKPANLFLSRSPDGSPLVKVLDFGLSKSSGVSQEPNLTATSTIMGTPLYMSPEQLRSSKNVDARTDVWALGVILYELLAGRLPFEADTVTGLCAKIAADAPTPLREIDPTLPASLEAVVLRCLEKDVKRRLASVAELAVVLLPFASAEGKLAVNRIARIGGGPNPPSGGSVKVPAGAIASTVGGQTDTAWQTTGAPRRRTATFVATGVALVVGVGIVLALRSTRPDVPKATALVPPPASAQAAVPVVAATPVPTVAATADISSAVPSASTVASSSPVASAAAKTSAAAAGKRPPKPPATQAPAVNLLLNRK